MTIKCILQIPNPYDCMMEVLSGGTIYNLDTQIIYIPMGSRYLSLNIYIALVLYGVVEYGVLFKHGKSCIKKQQGLFMC